MCYKKIKDVTFCAYFDDAQKLIKPKNFKQKLYL